MLIVVVVLLDGWLGELESSELLRDIFIFDRLTRRDLSSDASEYQPPPSLHSWETAGSLPAILTKLGSNVEGRA